MDNIKKNLNYIGITLCFAAFVLIRIWPYKKTIPYILLGLGVLSLLLYIYLNLSLLKQGLKRRSFLYSSNLLIMVILVIGILVLINYIFSKYHHRFDFTEAKVHSLSDQSVTVLKNLENEVKITSFFLEGNYQRNTMQHLMDNYTYHTSKIKHEFIDPDKNPGLVKRYEVTEDGTSIFESGDKESRITSTSEEEITNAIIKISREKKKTIYFLEGHGEGSIEDLEDGGYSQAKAELEKLAYEVKKLSLALPDTFPDDVDLLVIPGPQKDLFPDELETIRNFINKGGRVFFMIDPQTAPGLSPFLAEFGVKLEDDVIVDTVSRLMGGDYFMPVVSEYEYHDITSKFRYATFFPFTRSVDIAEELPEGIDANVLAKTSQNSWSERQLTEQQVTFDEERDKPGPIPLAVVATIEYKEGDAEEESTTGEEPEGEQGAEATQETPQEEDEGEGEAEIEEEKPKSEGRLAVFGDSEFVSNRYYYTSGNGNFFLNTAAWLTEEADLISIQPKTASPKTIQLTPSQGRMIFFVSLIILPLAVLVTGITIWARRKAL
jgi:ABC-type uncharacterized transport system involved in gliding motility auxiliary subunit